jgi:predicted RNA polymerase sigma factor
MLATLLRLLGDFDLAEEAMHEAFGAAGPKNAPI